MCESETSTVRERSNLAGLSPRFWWTAGAALVLDGGSRWAANEWLSSKPPVDVVGSLIRLRVAYNAGFAFDLSIPGAGRAVHLLFGAIVMVGMLWIAAQVPRNVRGGVAYTIAFAFMFAAALGNIGELLTRGHVTDFIEIAGRDGGPLTINVADLLWIVGGFTWVWLRTRDGLREEGWHRMMSIRSFRPITRTFFPPSLRGESDTPPGPDRSRLA